MTSIPLLIALALAGQAPESPPPSRPPIAPAAVRLRELEDEARAIREEVQRELADAAVAPEQAVNEAKRAWDDATRAREAAEGAVAAYTLGALRLDIETKKSAIALAESDLQRAEGQFDWYRQAVDRGQELAGNGYVLAKLKADRAAFEVETARTELDVLEKYQGPKEAKRLEALAAGAADAEQIKKREYERQAERLRRRRAEAARLQARTPEDLVVAILDDVIRHEARLVELTRELAANQPGAKPDPDRLRANRDAVANTARQIKEDLALATAVAEEARQARDRLLQAERRLLAARRVAEAAAK